MSIAVTNVTRGQDLTPYYQPTSLVLRQSGAAFVMTAEFRVIDRTPGQTLVIEAEDEITISVGGTESFRGRVRNRVRTDTGLGPNPERVYRLTLQDLTADLTDDVLEVADGVRPAETDRARVQAIIGASTKGIIAPDATVQQLVVPNLPEQDLTGANLYEALEEVSKLIPGGASFYVDWPGRRLHWFQTETESAPFHLSDTPDDVMTFGYDDLRMPDDTFELVNAVYCIGGPSTTPVWRHAANNATAASSEALYGRKEGTLRDPDQEDQAALEAMGDALIAQLAFPRGPIELVCYRPGLRAGMRIQLTSSLWGIAAVEYPIVQLVGKPILSEDYLEYELTLNDAPTSLGRVISSRDGAITSAVSAAAQALEQVPDATPPATPTGLALSSGYDIADDGVLRVYLDAEWLPNGEPDLQAYELQIDEARRSTVTFTAAAVVGGGTMPAGDYSVQVTALGPHGETAGQSPPQTVTIAAGNRLGVTITAYAEATSYRIFASRTADPLHVSNTTTTGAQVVIDAEGAGVPAPTSSTYATFANPQSYRSALERAHIEDLLAGTYYAARVRALDDWNNRSGWSASIGATTARDIVAPDIPGGLSAVAGFRLVGLTWQRSGATDLDRYEVRYSPDLAGSPDPSLWVRLTARSNAIVIVDLEPDTAYWFEVRAVDRSNNVQTSSVDSTAVDADSEQGAGWSASVAATPTLVGAADVAFNSVLTDILTANRIDAADIQAGTLTLGGLANTPDYLLVYNGSGQEIGRWDSDGLLIRDPLATDKMLRLVDGVLSFSRDGGSTWTTAISAEGIVADAIRLGASPGGHNSIPNSSFELSAFATYLTKVWTSSADWATGTSQVAVSTAGTSLTLTNATY